MDALQIILFLILIVLTFYKWRSSSLASKKRLPPSPLRVPIIGHLHLVGKIAHRSFESLSKRYGELMLLHFGKVPVVVVSSAEAAREIMKTQDLVFSSRPRLSIAEKLLYGCKDVAFAAYGDHWRQARSMCVVQLLSNKKVQSYRRIREEETSLMVETIRQQQQQVVNLREAFKTTTNDIICRAALGRKYKGEGERDFNQILDKFVVLLGNFDVGDYVPWLSWINQINGADAKVKKVGKLMDDFLEGVLQEYREKKVTEREDDAAMDFVEILLEFQRECQLTGASPVEDDTIKAITLEMFGAGTETTYTALEWTMAELMKNPRVMRNVQREVREVIVIGDDENSKQMGGEAEDALEKMPYLKAVAKESLRLHPPLPLLIPREVTEDTRVLGYDIPAGAQVLVNSWAISRDPSMWEKPLEFRPERFLETSIDYYRGLHFEMLPFGAGRRGCPGITFAMSVFELALSKLLYHFDFALPDGLDLDMTEASGIAAHLKSPLHLIVTPPTSI